MKNGKLFKRWLPIISISLVMFLGIILLVTALSYAKDKIQYKVAKITRDTGDIQSTLDKFSSEGWELVSHFDDVLIFKKEGTVSSALKPDQISTLDKVKCPKCGAVFPGNDTYNTVPGRDELVKCPKCSAIFKKADYILK